MRIGQILVKLQNLKYPPETPPPPKKIKKIKRFMSLHCLDHKKNFFSFILFFSFLKNYILFIFDYMSSVEDTRTQLNGMNRHQNGKINGSFFKSPNTFLGFRIFLY